MGFSFGVGFGFAFGFGLGEKGRRMTGWGTMRMGGGAGSIWRLVSLDRA